MADSHAQTLTALAQGSPDLSALPKPRRPWRLAELFLLILALGISIGGFAIVSHAVTGELPQTFYGESVTLVVLSLVMHVVIRIRAPWADQTLLPCVVLLTGIGLTMILRLDMRGTLGADAPRSALWALVSVGAASLVLIAIKDHRTLRRFTYTSGIVGMIVLLSPLIPGLGVEINGSRRWIIVAGFSLQPGEFAKILLAIFFAGYLCRTRDNLALAGPRVLGLHLPRLRDLGPILVVWAMAIVVLVSQVDLGTSLLLFGMFVSMLYMATGRSSWVLIGLSLVAAGGWFAVGAFPHVAQRFDGWINAFDPVIYNRPVGGSFQLVQGLLSMSSGGLFGTGLGQGHPYLVPFSFSDFIYTSLGEELGLTGILAILVIFFIIVERGFRTALEVRDPFGKLLSAGLSFMLAWQLFVIVGGVTRVLPLTGLTVPFMAQGGSALLSNWIFVALLIRLSNSARRPSTHPGLAEVAQPHTEPLAIPAASPDSSVIVVGPGSDEPHTHPHTPWEYSPPPAGGRP